MNIFWLITIFCVICGFALAVTHIIILVIRFFIHFRKTSKSNVDGSINETQSENDPLQKASTVIVILFFIFLGLGIIFGVISAFYAWMTNQ